MPETKFQIYTDGSCIGNPGPGGWGFIIHKNGEEVAAESGSDKDTTNNRMEMMAIIQALDWLHKNEKPADASIEVKSDSNLIIQTINQGWKKKANTDLWAQIDKLRAWLNIKWTWVKAHADDDLNNRVDEMAFKAANKA